MIDGQAKEKADWAPFTSISKRRQGLKRLDTCIVNRKLRTWCHILPLITEGEDLWCGCLTVGDYRVVVFAFKSTNSSPSFHSLALGGGCLSTSQRKPSRAGCQKIKKICFSQHKMKYFNFYEQTHALQEWLRLASWKVGHNNYWMAWKLLSKDVSCLMSLHINSKVW